MKKLTDEQAATLNAAGEVIRSLHAMEDGASLYVGLSAYSTTEFGVFASGEKSPWGKGETLADTVEDFFVRRAEYRADVRPKTPAEAIDAAKKAISEAGGTAELIAALDGIKLL